MLNQNRSVPARCLTTVAGDKVDGGTAVVKACSSLSPATLLTTVAR